MAVIQPIEWNIFGVPYVGSDICGFNGEPSEELCLRWMQLGSFHSFSRNHNGIGYRPQDPAQWGSVAAASRKALGFRYKYLPTLYSMHQSVSQNGGTVVRGLFMNYPQDGNTHNIGLQFMWGDKLLITPVVDQGRSDVRGYFPNDRWYSVYDYDYGRIQSPGYHTLRAPTNSLPPLHTRGGTMLVGQEPGLNTADSRDKPFELLVSPDANDEATGELYWDDGESIVSKNHFASSVHHVTFHYSADQKGGQLTVARQLAAPDVPMPPLDRLEVLGYKKSVDFSSFQVDGQPIGALLLAPHTFNGSEGGRLHLQLNRPVDMTLKEKTVVSWSHH
jgi:alpha-glucosidase (family GH31 glycosyl hydrolase)